MQRLLNIYKEPYALPSACFALFIFVYTFLTGLMSPRVATLMAVLGIGTLAFEALRRNMVPVFLQKLGPMVPWILFALLGYALLPLIPYAGSRAWNNLTGVVFAMSVFSVVRVYGQMRFVEPLFMGYVFIVLFFFILFPSVLGVGTGQERLRLSSEALGQEKGLNPNDVARLMGVSGLFILGSFKMFSIRLLAEGRGIVRLLNVAKLFGVLGAIYVIMFHSGSRAALAWVAAMVGYVFAAQFNRNLFVAGVLCTFGATLGLVTTFFLFPDIEVFSRITVLFDDVAMRGEGEKSFFTRWYMIQEALKLWMQSPLWGNGNEAYRVYGSYGTYSHTNYTELLANYGLLGLCFFYGPIVAASWQSWKMRSSQNKQIRRQSLWLLICCLILFPISLVNVIYYTKYMLLFYGVVLGRVYYLKDNYQRLSSFGGEGPYSPRHSQHGYR